MPAFGAPTAADMEEFLERYVLDRWGKMLDGRFFRGTVTSVATNPNGDGYLVGIQRTNASAPDGNAYLSFIRGYRPQIADVVECLWRDNNVGLVLGCIKQAGTYVDAALPPAGAVTMFAGASTPAGWLACDGSAVSRTTYAALFTAIGTVFGVGDGSTTFNVPDLRGRAPIGAGTGPGLTARGLGSQVGEEAHMLSTAELAAHNHGVNDPTHNHAASQTSHSHRAAGPNNFVTGGGTAAGLATTGASYVQTASTDTQTPAVTVGGAGTGVSTQNAGAGSAHNTMQPSIALNYIIKI